MSLEAPRAVELPAYDCRRCDERTHDPSGLCPDCFLEQRGR